MGALDTPGLARDANSTTQDECLRPLEEGPAPPGDEADRGVGVDASNLDVPDDPDSETVETGLEPYFVRLEFESELLRLLRQDGL